MRRTLRSLVPILCPLTLSLACGSSAGNTSSSGATGGSSTTNSSSSTSTGSSNSSTGSSSSSTGSSSGGLIPDPGTTDQVDNDFMSVEPNNTPQQATPLGTAMGAGVAVWVSGNTTGGSSNPADYFVFKSGPAGDAGAPSMTFNICFTPPITAMTATLWKVANGAQVMPPVGTWMSTGSCVTSGTTGAPLMASTEYLFGLTATGGPGMYSA
jgi:hypothetical protein